MRGDLQFVHPHHVFAVAALGLALGCSRSGPGSSDATPPEAAVAESAAGELLRGFDQAGRAAEESLAAACDDRPSYIQLRRAAVALLSVWRRSNALAAEATFGPEVSILEAGGSIGSLDRAMTVHDCPSVVRATRNIGASFRVEDAALARHGIARAVFAQALSDAAYRLGEAAMESTPYVPENDDAALADVLGLLDFLEGGVQAMGFDVGVDLRPLLELRQAHTLAELCAELRAEVGDRASLVVATGVLGHAIRREALAQGLAPILMIRPLGNVSDVSALTLPRPAAPSDPGQAALGRRLFFDPRLSAGGVRACATCHVPERAFADGIVAPTSLDPAAPLRRNTPSLLYAPLEAALTWDGRVRTADRQALMVIHTRGEMGLTDTELTRAIASDPTYAQAFRAAFHESVTPQDIGLALAAYESSEFVPGTAPIDRFARGDRGALSADAKAGFDVFAGKGRCARCHIPPVFGGSRPPDFTAPVFAVLGVPSAPNANAVDADRGRNGAFRVPTVRNMRRTAPYFHHGRYATLEQVVDFYDRGGGRGLGLDVPNQDPEIRPLHLSVEDKRVLVVFLHESLDDAP
jgi:cytochrome c peroxidase